MNPINQYVKCYRDTVETDIDFLDLCKIWEVDIAQGKHLIKTGAIILHKQFQLN